MRAMLRSLRWLMLAVLVVVPGRVVFGETVAGLPAPAGYVNDFAGVLSAETRQSLEELCTEVDQQGPCADRRGDGEVDGCGCFGGGADD